MDNRQLKIEIGKRIAEARDWKGLSQTDLADQIGVTRAAPGQWEIGKTSPSMLNLIKTALITDYAVEWLATARGDKFPTERAPDAIPRGLKEVSIISWVSAGRLADADSQIPVDDVPKLAIGGLGRGEFFALKVQGDSMDRISPDGSIIIVNRADRTLIAGKAYVFSERGETTYKLWQPEPARLVPHSTNPVHQPKFIRRRRDIEVVGRVRRSILEL